jgi:hypothetical protein
MASENIKKEVIVSLKLDTSNLEKEQKNIASRLIDVKEQVKSLNKELSKETNPQAREKLKTQLFDIQKEQKQLVARQKEVNKELETNAKIVNSNVGSNNQLRALLSKLTAELNALGEGERQTTEKGKQLAQTVLEITDQLKANESAVGDNRRNVGNYTKIELAELIAALKKENQSLEQVQQTTQNNIKKGIGFNDVTKDGTVVTKGFTNSLNQENKALMTNEQVYESATNQIAANNAEIENLERTMIGFTTNVNKGSEGAVQYENNLAGLTQKVSDLKKQLATQEIGSETFEKTNKAIKDTEFQIQKVQGKVDEFGNKEPKNLVKKSYDDLADATAGVVGGIQLAEIAFGKSNSTAEAQARILKLVAVQQAVVNVAKSVGAVNDLKQVAIEKLKILQMKNFTAASIANAQATGTMSVAQKVYAQVVGKSTGSMKAFKLALAGTGIGAVVILLSELIFNFDAVSKVVNRTVNRIKDFSANVSNGNKVVKSLLDILLLFASPLVTIIRLISDFEGTVKEVQTAVLDLANRVKDLTSDIPILGDVVKFFVGNLEAVIKTANQVATSLGLMGKKKFKTDIEELGKFYDSFKYQLEQSQVALKNQIALLQASGNKSQQVAKLQRELLKQNIEAERRAFEVAEEIRKKTKISVDQLTGDQEKAYNDRKNAFIQAQQDLAIFEEQERQKSIERTKTRNATILDLTNELNRLRISLEKNEFERRRKEIEQGLIEERQASAQRIKDLQADGIDVTLIKQQEKERILLLEEIALRNLEVIKQDELKLIEETSMEAQEIKKDQIANDYQAQLELLTQSLVLEEKFQGLVTKSTAINEQERRDEQKKSEIQRLENLKNFYTKALELAKQFALTDNIIDPEEKKRIDELATALNGVEIEINAIQKKASEGLIPKDFAEKANFAIDQLKEVFGSLADAVSNSFSNASKEVDAVTNKQIKSIQQTTLTELQKEEQIQKAQEEGAKKKYELDVEAFKFKQAIDIASAVANLAQGIIAIFATPDPTLGVLSGIRAGILAATGAAQIGIIASQQPPPPPFEKGGYTGEGNPRTVSTKLGKKPYQYHADEYVVPSKVLRTPHGSALVGKLEAMRLNKIGSLGMSGFADGGLASSQINAGVVNSLDIEILSSKLLNGIEGIQPVVLVSDINRVQNNVKNAQVRSSL